MTGRVSRGARIGAAAIAAAALAGCALLDLRRDVGVLSGVGRVAGRLVRADEAAPVVVTLLDAPGDALRDYEVVPRAAHFELLVDAGRYRVAAFTDVDGDLVLDPQEPSAVSPVLSVGAGERVEGIVLELEPGGAASVGTVDLSSPGSHARLRPWKHRLGEVVALDDERFAPEIARRGLWQPVEFLIQPGPGLYQLEPYDPERVPVVFVHGIGGSPRDLAPLIARVDRGRFQVWVFYYASALRLEMNAALLQSAMRDLWAHRRFERFALVGYSMGGLVARAALNRSVAAGGADAIGLFFTLSTPWQGHAAAERGAERSPVVMPAWLDLAPGSDFLRRLTASPLPPAISHTMLFSHAGSSAFVSGASDGVVALSSQLDVGVQRAARRVVGLPETHVGILSSAVAGELLNEALEAAFPR